MAYRPSRRRQAEESEWAEPNITPMMNLMVVLIPLLLSTAEFVRLGVVEINLPPAIVDRTDEAQSMARLDLAVTITDRGFFITSNVGVLSGDRVDQPTIPLIAGPNDTMIHDYARLSSKLIEIKQRMEEVSLSR